MKLVTVVGARPQFVKAATVSRAISEFNKSKSQLGITESIIHTGQHYDPNMSDIFFEEMDIPKPTYSLGIGGSLHGAMTGRQLEAIEEILIEEKPNCVLVYGDTNSTLAGALAAAKLCIPVAHVEAGLRSFNMAMPEEINRILTDQISSLLFCPTEVAVSNLKNEGFIKKSCRVLNSGDVMLDAAIYYKSKARKPNIKGLASAGFVLVTIHRADNTDNLERLVQIVDALNEIAKTSVVVLPLHPRTRKMLAHYGLNLNALVTAPLSYFEMLWLLEHCNLVMTDSGGLQKEAYFFDKPCITLRDQTEWTELVDAGVNQLVGASYEAIIKAWSSFSSSKIEVKPSQQKLYGHGQAANFIVDALCTNFTG